MSMVKTLGHMMLGSMFISGGAGAFSNPDARAAKVANAGIPEPRQATILNGAVMTVAGGALAAGIMPKLAAISLIGALLPTTFVGHPFWDEEEGGPRVNQQIHFLKNVAMLGGLLLVLVEKDD